MSENNQLTRTEIIEKKIDRGITGDMELARHGHLTFANLNQIMEVARVVAVAQVAIPKHLRDNVGACLAICIQASEWEMSPFSVANKSYVVNDRLSYEAQLVNAVILKRAPIVGRFKIEYSGTGDTRRCKVSAKLLDGETVEYESPEVRTIPTKNSPLWKGDPDQQLFYYSSRALCRRHFPDVLLGIYTPDEMGEELREKPVTAIQFEGDRAAAEPEATPNEVEKPKRHRRTKAEIEAEKAAANLSGGVERSDTQDARGTAGTSPRDLGEPASESSASPAQSPNEAEGTGTPEQVAAFQKAAQPPNEEEEVPLLVQLRRKLLSTEVTEMQFKRYLTINGHVEPSDRFEKMSEEKLRDIVKSYDSLLDDVRASIK